MPGIPPAQHSSPATEFVTVVPHDTTPVAKNPNGKPLRGIYVGGVGDVSVISHGGVTVIFKAVPVGTILPISPNIIKNTNTDATLMVALYE